MKRCSTAASILPFTVSKMFHSSFPMESTLPQFRNEKIHAMPSCQKEPRLQDLPSNATIGTSSLRRQVQLRHRFPSLNLQTLRGNVDTRLRKLDAGDFDAIILAAAGLKRLGHEDRITEFLDDDIMVSAVGQGALGIVCRSADNATLHFLEALDHEATRTAVTAERGLFARSVEVARCRLRERQHSTDDRLTIKGLIASLDGRRVIFDELSGPKDQSVELGLQLGQKLLAMGAGDILAEIAQYGADR